MTAKPTDADRKAAEEIVCLLRPDMQYADELVVRARVHDIAAIIAEHRAAEREANKLVELEIMRNAPNTGLGLRRYEVTIPPGGRIIVDVERVYGDVWSISDKQQIEAKFLGEEPLTLMG